MPEREAAPSGPSFVQTRKESEMARVQATVIGKPYGRRQVGEIMTMSRRDALMLQQLGRVRIEDEGTYERRDMTARESGKRSKKAAQ